VLVKIFKDSNDLQSKSAVTVDVRSEYLKRLRTAIVARQSSEHVTFLSDTVVIHKQPKEDVIGQQPEKDLQAAVDDVLEPIVNEPVEEDWLRDMQGDPEDLLGAIATGPVERAPEHLLGPHIDPADAQYVLNVVQASESDTEELDYESESSSHNSDSDGRGYTEAGSERLNESDELQRRSDSVNETDVGARSMSYLSEMRNSTSDIGSSDSIFNEVNSGCL